MFCRNVKMETQKIKHILKHIAREYRSHYITLNSKKKQKKNIIKLKKNPKQFEQTIFKFLGLNVISCIDFYMKVLLSTSVQYFLRWLNSSRLPVFRYLSTFTLRSCSRLSICPPPTPLAFHRAAVLPFSRPRLAAALSIGQWNSPIYP